MKIQCDVCEKAPGTVICCADEAALCAKCDIEVHAANKLASKHQRLRLQCLSNKLPPRDICQEKPAFIFCVEDKAIFCQYCDEPIHSVGSLSATHQRFLASGIRVALGSSCSKDTNITFVEPPKPSAQQTSKKLPVQQSSNISSPWPGLLEFSDLESTNKKFSQQKEHVELGEFQWLAEMGLLRDEVPQGALSAAEVPQLTVPPTVNVSSCNYRSNKFNMSNKKIEISDEDDEFFTVPDLG